MQLRKLVLPAPFGPTMAWIVPGATATLTSESAVTPRKLSVSPVASSSAKRSLPKVGGGDGGKERQGAQGLRRIFCANLPPRGPQVGFGRPRRSIPEASRTNDRRAGAGGRGTRAGARPG